MSSAQVYSGINFSKEKTSFFIAYFGYTTFQGYAVKISQNNTKYISTILQTILDGRSKRR